jgi:sulfate permease, SulP family
VSIARRPIRLRLPPGLADLRRSADRSTTKQDATAGLVLGVESVPDGLAQGLLAGVNPVSGLYAYLFGMVGGACFTGSTFMSIQATGAMAIIVADVDLASRADPDRALFTLSVLTGVAMIAAGVLRLGAVLRFVSSSVMTGFITAVGINIVLGQLDNLTGYDAEGANRVVRALDLVTHFWRIDVATLVVGLVTIALIVALGRTRLGPLGLVVAVVGGSALAGVLDAWWADVATIGDLVSIPSGLPRPTLPVLGDIVALSIPAVSLAFVGLVQGAGVSAGVPNADGTFGDPSQDFVGQGAGNVVSGLFQGMPVGGSMSASSLIVAAGARTRLSMFVAGLVMAVVIVVLGDAVSYIAMPALAGLLIVVGVGTIKPNQVVTVAKTGTVQLTVMVTTLVLTMVIPLQYAVLVGVGLSAVMFVLQQSSRLTAKRVVFEGAEMREVDPPRIVPAREVVVIQPYGSIFFATAKSLEEQMPTATSTSRGSVVILRIRGADEVGATLLDVLGRYSRSLHAVGSKLVVVTDNPRILRQLRVTGLMRELGEENVYRGTEWVGRTLREAHSDAEEWVTRQS